MIEIRIAEEMLHLLSIKYDDGSMTGVALIFWSSFMIVAHVILLDIFQAGTPPKFDVVKLPWKGRCFVDETLHAIASTGAMAGLTTLGRLDRLDADG